MIAPATNRPATSKDTDALLDLASAFLKQEPTAAMPDLSNCFIAQTRKTVVGIVVCGIMQMVTA